MKTMMIIYIFFSYFFTLSLKSQQINRTEQYQCLCLQSRIRFNDASIEKIVMHPEEILAEPDSFWMQDSAYQLVKLWHQRVSLPVPMEQWKTWIQSYKNIPPEDRDKDSQLTAARKMMKKETEFNQYFCIFHNGYYGIRISTGE